MADATSPAPSPFLDPSFMEDPYPALAKLRAEDPVHFVAPMGFWVILRHDDVKRLFNDPENATPDGRARAAPQALLGRAHAPGGETLRGAGSRDSRTLRGAPAPGPRRDRPD